MAEPDRREQLRWGSGVERVGMGEPDNQEQLRWGERCEVW